MKFNSRAHEQVLQPGNKSGLIKSPGFRALLPLLLLVLAAGPVKAGVDALDTWQWRNPLPVGNTLSCVTFGNGTFVALGAGGTVLESPDGINWTNANTGPVTFSNITCVSGTFVAVGANGKIATSPDGLAWTSQTSGVTTTLTGASYGNGLFVVVGNGGVILTSPDGAAWSSGVSGTAKDLYAVTYANGKFVVVGNNGTILTSPDGGAWSPSNSGITSALNGVIFGAGKFVAIGPRGSSGNILTSPDGVTWSNSGTHGSQLSSIAYGSGFFVVIGTGLNNGVLTSPDGVTWSQSSSTVIGSGTPVATAYGNGTFVAVGTDPTLTYGAIWTSPNGGVWASRYTCTIYSALHSVVYANHTVVVAGYLGAILTSSNAGVSWYSHVIGQFNSLNSVTAGMVVTGTTSSNLFVIVGDGNVVLTSSDTVTWASPSSPLYTDFAGVTYGKGKFVAVGNNGGIISSGDGKTWTGKALAAQYNLSSVTYGNGNFVAVGSGTDSQSNPIGTIVSSTDGATWVVHNPGTASGLSSVAFANGIFVTGGSNGTIFNSPDGSTWNAGNSGTTANVTGIASGDGIFVAVCDNGTLLSSTDGATWTPRDPGAANPKQLSGIGYGYGTFIALGAVGTILQSQTLEGVGPFVTTQAATLVSATSATMNGIVNPNGSAAIASFEYSTSPFFFTPSTSGSSAITTGSTGVPVSIQVNGLAPSQTYYFRVHASNANGAQDGSILSFATAPIAPVITSSTTVTGFNGSPFNYQIVAINVPASYSALGLPQGLSVNPSTGLISGTVLTNGTFSANISATNTAGTGMAPLVITIMTPASPVINSSLSATGTEGEAFNYQITATNNPTGYGASGLPPGLGVSASTGLISGTPTATGTFAPTMPEGWAPIR